MQEEWEAEMESEEQGYDSENIDRFFRKFVNEKYHELNNNVNICSKDTKDLKVSFELFRREIAMQFISRESVSARESEIETNINGIEHQIKEIREELQVSQRNSINIIERIWLHLISIGAIIVLVIELLDYVQRLR